MIEGTQTDSGAIAASTIRFILEQGDHRGEAYTAALDVCQSPTCGCGVVWLDAVLSADPSGAGADPGQGHRFPLDVIERNVPDTVARDLPVQDLNFAHAVERELDDPQWKELRGRFFVLKKYVVDHADMDEVDAQFPEHDVEVEGLMVGYHDIFPFGGQIVLQDGSLAVVAFDQYCVRPGCRCTGVGLDLVAPGGEGPAASLGNLIFDHRANTWLPRSGPPRSGSLDDAAVSRLLASDPELASTLRTRHRILKRLYARYRRAHAAPASPDHDDSPVVGRNDPCPCGSGRKYKHCCGK